MVIFVASFQQAAEASPDASVEVQPDKPKASEAVKVAYPDEGSSWRVGDVRRHKKVFEDMKGENGKISFIFINSLLEVGQGGIHMSGIQECSALMTPFPGSFATPEIHLFTPGFSCCALCFFF